MKKFLRKFDLTNKRTWKQILSIALAVLACVASIFGVVKLAESMKSKTKEIHPTFSVGGLSANGEYEKTDDSIYTKELIECQGLAIEPNFDTNVAYEVYYYAHDKEYVGSTGELNEVYSLANDDFIDVQYARIVIYPDMGEESAEDFKVHFWEVAGIANDLTITVNKKQTPYVAKNFYELDSTLIGKRFEITDGVGEYVDNPTFYNSKWFSVNAGETYLVGIEDTFVSSEQVAMFNLKYADGTYSNALQLKFNCENSGEMLWVEFTMPENAVMASLFANNASGTYKDFTINLK